jgi:hypothetical protein
MLSLVESAKKYGRSADPAALIQFARNIRTKLVLFILGDWRIRLWLAG